MPQQNQKRLCVNCQETCRWRPQCWPQGCHGSVLPNHRLARAAARAPGGPVAGSARCPEAALVFILDRGAVYPAVCCALQHEQVDRKRAFPLGCDSQAKVENRSETCFSTCSVLTGKAKSRCPIFPVASRKKTQQPRRIQTLAFIGCGLSGTRVSIPQSACRVREVWRRGSPCVTPVARVSTTGVTHHVLVELTS